MAYINIQMDAKSLGHVRVPTNDTICKISLFIDEKLHTEITYITLASDKLFHTS